VNTAAMASRKWDVRWLISSQEGHLLRGLATVSRLGSRAPASGAHSLADDLPDNTVADPIGSIWRAPALLGV